LEFKVVDWENYSNIGLGRPQDLITKQTLEKYKDSLVLFIGLLGQRFGTKTGKSESGTKEEFKIALDYRQEHGNYPEIKWFFRKGWGKAGIPTNSEELRIAGEQTAKVESFQTTLWKEGEQQSYTQSFQTSEEFPDILEHDLLRWLHDSERSWNKASEPDKTKPQLTEKIPLNSTTPYFDTWQRLLAAECVRLPLQVLDPRQGLDNTADPIKLPDIFVPLKAVAPTKKWLEAEQPNAQLVREITTAKHSDSSTEAEDVIALLEQQRLTVLLGESGFR
jgi:hypothetical protein